ncbi:MAG: HupE/UreJ family protein [Reyranellaceae bacterium]
MGTFVSSGEWASSTSSAASIICCSWWPCWRCRAVLRQTVSIVTGFTVAHSITLSLAVLGVVHVPSRIVEPLIAASIVWVAMENLVALAGAGRRWLIAQSSA